MPVKKASVVLTTAMVKMNTNALSTYVSRKVKYDTLGKLSESRSLKATTVSRRVKLMELRSPNS